MAALTVVVSMLVAMAAMAQQAPTLRALVGQTFTARVTTIVDGDTVDVRLATGAIVRVRLEGIDAPEKGRPFSVAARNATRVALFDQVATVRAADVDRYHRLVARVTANGHDSSLALVEAGLACHFMRYSSDEGLAEAQAAAKSAARGFWTNGGQRPPACATAQVPAHSTSGATVRHSLTNEIASDVFHGNRHSKVYHAPTCRNYNCPNCVVVFKSHEAAHAAGFRPSGDCFR